MLFRVGGILFNPFGVVKIGGPRQYQALKGRNTCKAINFSLRVRRDGAIPAIWSGHVGRSDLENHVLGGLNTLPHSGFNAFPLGGLNTLPHSGCNSLRLGGLISPSPLS